MTLGWVFFRTDTFTQAGRWFLALAGLGPGGPAWSTEVGLLADLVVVWLLIVRLCPNSLELPLERLTAVPQAGLAAATATALVLMNCSSKFLYFQF